MDDLSWTGLTDGELANVVGKPVDEQRAALLAQIYGALRTVVGSDDSVLTWLRGKNLELGGAVPLDRMRTREGLADMAHYVTSQLGRA